MGNAHDGPALADRGWLPLVSLCGNCLLLPIDAPLAYRLKEALAIDPFAPPEIAATVELGLRLYVDKIVPVE
jgi:hypothetical protein